MPIASPADRLRLFRDEVRRLGEMYRVAYEAHVSQGLAGLSGESDEWPRPEALIGPRAATFRATALRYLEAVRPNSAAIPDITRYVQRWIGTQYSPNACSQAMAELVREGLVERIGLRGRWKATKPFKKAKLQGDAGGKPEINAPGLRAEVRRLILAYGPLGTEDLVSRVQVCFSIGGRNPVANFHTMISKCPDIRFWPDVGFVLKELVDLEPSIRPALRRRKAIRDPLPASSK